jgi:DNA-binding response OmpR family regulator
MSALIILVNTDSRTLRHTEALLTEQGYLVVPVSSSTDAEQLLGSVMPDLLIADFRLGRSNGLQLAARTHQDYPDMPIIVTYAGEAPVVADATPYGAILVAAPLENPEFLARVQDAVAWQRRQQRRIRRWFRKPLADMVEVDAADARAQIIDLSYTGVQLAFREGHHIPENFNIALPTGDVPVSVRRVWVARSPNSGQICCGAQLDDPGAGPWRAFVNSLRNPEAS